MQLAPAAHLLPALCALAVLATWLPGRTAAGLKQAAANLPTASSGSPLSPQVIETLQADIWPLQLTPLMAAWPGPPTCLRVSQKQQHTPGTAH